MSKSIQGDLGASCGGCITASSTHKVNIRQLTKMGPRHVLGLYEQISSIGPKEETILAIDYGSNQSRGGETRGSSRMDTSASNFNGDKNKPWSCSCSDSESSH
jgi:hypothetical protein